MSKSLSTKKILSLILAAAILFSTFVIAASAANFNYDPSAAASYATKYAYSYNPNYTSYKGRGGDCANFVSQCLYYGGISKTSNWKPDSYQWINCGGLKSFLCSTLGCSIISQPSASQISVGDVMYYNNGAHVCIVSSIDNGVPKVCGHTADTKNGSYKQGYSTYSVIKLGKRVTHTIDGAYPKNFTAYPKAKITGSNIFDANHCMISSSAWIGTSDKCTIHEVYTDGCCKVTYPLDSGGTKTVYSYISLFTTVKNYYLDLNSYLDGSYRGDISGIATADVYINGRLVANDVTDYYTSHPSGTTYKITDIRTKSGYKNNGSSSYSGTLYSNVNVNLSFSKVQKTAYLDLNSYLDGAYRGDISGIATADVYINGRLVANDVTDFYQAYPVGTTYKVTDIRTKSGYKYNGSSSYSGTLNSNVNINLSFSKVITYFTTNTRMKSGTYTTAYSSYTCSSSVGRIYNGDVITIKRIYSNGVAQVVCPWSDSSGNYNKTVYCKVSELKFRATKYINAYDLNGSYVGRVYQNDLVSVAQIYSNGTWRVFCPWTGGYQREILIVGSNIY